MVEEPLPNINEGAYPPVDGLLQKVPSFCKEVDRPKCREFYASINTKAGFNLCPYGFASYGHQRSSGEIVTYTTLRVSGLVKKKSLKDKLKSDDVPILQPQTIIRIAQQWEQPAESYSKARLLKVEAGRSINFAKSMVHEIRRLNGIIKAESETLSRNLGQRAIDVDRGEVQRNQVTIYQSSRLISIRLNVFDFLENPSRITSEARKPIPVHKQFYKVQQSLHVDRAKKHAEIYLEGESTLALRGWDIFEMLPFVLLDNAIKYSLPDHSIEVKFIERSKSLTVSIGSIGPALLEGEQGKIFEEGYRGNAAKSIEPVGDGLGLALANEICKIHDIDIEVHSGSVIKSIDGIGYSNFIVELKFPVSMLIENRDVGNNLRLPFKRR